MWAANVNGTGYDVFEHVQPPISAIGGESPSRLPNLLIAPIVSWHSCGPATPNDCTGVFAGSVEPAWLDRANNVNQNHHPKFDFVSWRAEGVQQHNSH